jgi:hypothetical protein
MKQLEATIKCGHCGNVGICKVKASYTYDILVEATDEYEQRMWFLFQCSSCSRPILAESVILEKEKLGELPDIFKINIQLANGNAGDQAGPILFEYWSDNNKILYPQDKIIEDQWMLPYRVAQAYSAALRVQKADAGAFAIMVGRTLEEICHNEKAKGKVLADKIKSLADSGRIPQVLADMFMQLRLLRNVAAHVSEDGYEVKEEDVPIIRQFMDAILEYLYIAPMKITRLQDRVSGKSLTSKLDLSDHPF